MDAAPPLTTLAVKGKKHLLTWREIFVLHLKCKLNKDLSTPSV